ncbi:MAG TPA: pyridoxamine 5'-phosphate oxidase [Pyrinomonadaceae bacterium]|nr:pyridoxamine 5'-phosphate oxidase [Pyrinomonadaceae bacterium]
MDRKELAELRRDFASEGLLKSSVALSPFDQFARWMDEALKADIIDANAMTLATVGEDRRPSARVVLLKYFGETGFAFFTNYKSKKARDLSANPHAVLNFFWPQIDRQVAICGEAEKTSREESEKYFNSRPVESRLGAWASNQSSVIESRDVLEQRVDEFRRKFGDNVPLPDFWGGFRVLPTRFEFWQGRQSRLHDRIVYEMAGDAWTIVRLSP